MTEMETVKAIIDRDWGVLEGIAKAEQWRQIDVLQQRASAERNPVKQAEASRKIGDVDHAWEEIRLWIMMRVRPENLAAALSAAAMIANKANDAWTKANGGRAGHPQVGHWLGLIVINRELSRAFPAEAQAMKAAA
jgi:hypothetical protein